MCKNSFVILFSILSAFCFSNSRAQSALDSVKADKVRFGIVIYNIRNNEFDQVAPASFNINIYSKKHAFFFGPRILDVPKHDPGLLFTSNRYYRYNSNTVQNIGLVAGYQYVVAERKCFNLALEYSFSYYSVKYRNSNEIGRVGTDYILQNSLGYAMKVKFLKKFFLYQHTGVGPVIYITESPNSSHLSSLSNFLFTAKFGLGYDF